MVTKKEMKEKIKELQIKNENLEQKIKELRSAVGGLGDSDNEIQEMDFAKTPTRGDQGKKAKGAGRETFVIENVNIEIQQEYVYNQSINFEIDQRQMHGQANTNNDQTVIASRVPDDDRDIIIQRTREEQMKKEKFYNQESFKDFTPSPMN